MKKLEKIQYIRLKIKTIQAMAHGAATIFCLLNPGILVAIFAEKLRKTATGLRKTQSFIHQNTGTYPAKIETRFANFVKTINVNRTISPNLQRQ